MADQQHSTTPDAGTAPKQSTEASTSPPPPPPSYSKWRTAAHIYFPLFTVLLLLTFGTPFDTAIGNLAFTALCAIPTNWFASLFYPTDRPDPTPEQTVRFSSRHGLYRAGILFVCRCILNMPIDMDFFIIDFGFSFLSGPNMFTERPAGNPRRSEFVVHLPWMIGSYVLVLIAPSFLTGWMLMLDRMVWRSSYVAFMDDLIGILARPNLKTWKGKVRLVLAQAFVIITAVSLVLRWRINSVLAMGDDERVQAALAALDFQDVRQQPVEMELGVEDDGDRYLI